MNTFCSDTNNPAPIKSIRSGEKILFLDEIKIMGILNLTPDSFYDGSRYINNYQNQNITTYVNYVFVIME